MKNNIHEILSEIHHVLSIATADELRAASSLPTLSPHIQRALEALAQEKAATAIWGNPSKTVTSRRLAKNGKLDSDEEVRPEGITRKVEESLKDLSKEELSEICQSLKLPIQVGPKDGRSRIIKRLARQLGKMPNLGVDDIVKIAKRVSDRQTEGWVGVISKGK